ncbi:MAG: hypothetical protein JWR10_846 [Rubritepida sp.]|nr:hypothetical protein [Rubritepida sp.]
MLDTQSGRTRAINPEIIQMFQCSAQGCNLSTVGLTKLINFHSKTGITSSEAVSLAQNSIVNGQKYGWRGGTFPGIWVAATPSAPALSSRARSGAFSGAPGPDPFAGF